MPVVHHPETGQPITILRSDAKISRDQRTLLWVTADLEPSPRWSRWSTLVADAAALPVLSGSLPTCVVLRDTNEAWRPFLTADREGMLVLGTKAAIRDWTAKGVDTSNILFLHELFELYPFLGEPVSDEDPLEKIVVTVAHVLRHHRIAWRSKADLGTLGLRAQIRAWQRCLSTETGNDIMCLPSCLADDVVPACWLIQQYFRHPLPRRAREIRKALEKNLVNPYIDRILLLNETEDLDLPVHDKLQTHILDRRMTYLDALVTIRTHVPSGGFAVFANSDIWFDDTLGDIWSISLEKRRLFLALLRWEEGREGEEPTLFGPRADSQDAWILAKATADSLQLTEDRFGFPFGKPGCDNAIALAMLQQKCLVVNPAYSIRTHHIHASNIRNYNPQDILYKPMYLYVDPTAIQTQMADTTGAPHWIAKDAKALWKAQESTDSFACKIHPIEDDVGHILVTALNRKYHGQRVFELEGANIWTPSESVHMPLYEWKEPVFVTAEGLVSNARTLFIGPHAGWQRGWEEAKVSTMTPAIHVPSMISVGCQDGFPMDLTNWVLHSLPTIIRVQAAAPVDELHEFLVPPEATMGAFLQDCRWRRRHVGSVPVVENACYYTNHLLAVPPRQANWVTAEDVAVLRSLLPAHASSEKKPVLVLCLSALLTAGWAEEVQACHGESVLKGWQIIVLETDAPHRQKREAFQKADWIVGSAAALQWIWMAAPGTHMLEYVDEQDIRADILHLAGAAECTYIPTLVRREPVEFQRQRALLDIGKAIQRYGFREMLETRNIPDELTVVVPKQEAMTGIWTHAVDTFREMVDLWVLKGFCRKRESAETSYCWWGGIGEILLYDWDTPRWMTSDVNYQMALIGNPVPMGPRQSVWSFWGRHPKQLEAWVDAKGILAWKDRSIESLFLGKVENGVQKTHRCSVDWSTAVELFSMPVDPTGEPYPYTQDEYLQKVAEARYGLCLRGYGSKCNREIEYFALGTVPIVTEGVDMTHYLNPPREGVHYLRAKGPADVSTLIEKTSCETWERMSRAGHAWWRQNASAEGLFRLTWARIEQSRSFFSAGVLPPWIPRH